MPTVDAKPSESSFVLDSSALLALALGEPGAEVVRDALIAGAAIGAVNLSEVLTRLVELGASIDQAEEMILQLNPRVIDFDATHARVAASLRVQTRPLGLSLRDRACLALGLAEDVPVLTADRTWASLDFAVEVRLIR